jgi:hypothetical protein
MEKDDLIKDRRANSEYETSNKNYPLRLVDKEVGS